MNQSAVRNPCSWPLQVFYDGQCRLCSREIEYYRKLDRQGRLIGIDIADPAFRAADYDLDARAVDRLMHVRTADGRVATGVDAFLWIWEAVGKTRWIRVANAPGMKRLLRLGYSLFARYRHCLTGRCRSRTPSDDQDDHRYQPSGQSGRVP